MQLSNDTTTRTLQLIEAIARELGILVDPEPHMPTVTKSIGTTGRDYSTITLWEADLDNSGIYASGDTAKGECYNDSAFDEAIVIDGGGTIGLSAIVMTVAAGQRHDGTAGTGARLVPSADDRKILTNTSVPLTIEWIELNANGKSLNNSFHAWIYIYQADAEAYVNHVLLHKGNMYVGTYGIYNSVGNFTAGLNVVSNSIVYDIENHVASSSYDCNGINGGAGGRTVSVLNCTVHNIRKTGASATATGIYAQVVQNCISTDVSSPGTANCFGASTDHNLSSDATAAGTGSLTNKTSANQFVSTTVGSEDLHLKAGADAIDAGTTLSSPTGITEDIDNVTRSGTWDIGADEYVAPPAGMIQQRIRSFRNKAITRM